MAKTEKTSNDDIEIDIEDLIGGQKPQIASDTGVILLMGPISLSSVANPIAYILEANLSPNSRLEFITLVISSPGGDMDAAFALIDVMQGSSIPVYTVGIGLVASAALVLFMAGVKGNRVLTPNTSILSHQWQTVIGGKSHELVNAQKQFSLINEKVMTFYKKNTSLSAKKIKELLLPANDVWLSSSEALQYGICDRVVECSRAITAT